MVKKIISIAGYSLRQWKANVRILLLFTVMLLLLWNDIRAVGDFSRMVGVPVNPLVYPFYSSNILRQLILMAGVIFLFSDAPFITAGQPYVMIRSRRISWIMGQILYVIAASAIYVGVLMGVSVLILLPYTDFQIDGWGKVINTLAQTNAGKTVNLQFKISEKIIRNYSPGAAFGLSFLLNWGTACFLGLLMFLFSLKWNKMAAMLAAGLILFLDLLVINVFTFSFFYHISPVSLSRLEFLDPIGITELPAPAHAFGFLGIVNFLLMLLLILGIRKTTVEITTEI